MRFVYVVEYDPDPEDNEPTARARVADGILDLDGVTSVQGIPSSEAVVMARDSFRTHR
jgi:hypothetical protein